MGDLQRILKRLTPEQMECLANQQPLNPPVLLPQPLPEAPSAALTVESPLLGPYAHLTADEAVDMNLRFLMAGQQPNWRLTARLLETRCRYGGDGSRPTGGQP